MNTFKFSEFSSSDSRYLGRGSYATVKRYFHEEKGAVVIKSFTLTGSNIDIKKKLEQIENEAKVLYRLQHKNIIKMFGVTEWETFYGIVMEDGNKNLEDLVIHENAKPILWPLRQQFCSEIAEGLSYLHYHDPKQSFIHGDLKLQNILLTKNQIVKIADFGAVSLQPATGFSFKPLHVTPSKQHTSLYAAPELLNNPDVERTRAMDVYSYALMVYEIITRKPVFLSSTQTGISLILQTIKEIEQKPDLKLVDDVKAALKNDTDLKICCNLEKIAMESWKTNPKDRPTIKDVKNKVHAQPCNDTEMSITTEAFNGLQNLTFKQCDPSFPAASYDTQNCSSNLTYVPQQQSQKIPRSNKQSKF